MPYLDLKMFLQPNLYGYYGTFLMGKGDAAVEDFLGTAMTISLGTNMRVEDTDRPDNGWWGESVLGTNIGSKLYLLDRSKAINETVNLAEQYAREALTWLIDDGHILDINRVTATYIGNYQYQILIVYETIDNAVRNHRHIFSQTEGA